MLRHRLIIEWVAILLVSCAIAIGAAKSELTQRLDHLLLDAAMPFASAPPSDDIVIVAIDDESLQSVGKWQWDRLEHAKLIRQITNAGAKTIAYDLLFPEQSSPTSDLALVEAAAESQRTVLPYTFQVPGRDGREFDLIPPFSALAEAAAASGHVALAFDSDGLVRRVQLDAGTPSEPMPHFMASTYQVAFGRVPAGGMSSFSSDKSPAEPVLIPLLPTGSFRTISARHVLAGEVPVDFFRRKIVLVGATAQGLGDSYPVAFSAGSVMSGIEIQANLLNALAADRFVTSASSTVSALGAVLATVLLMLTFWMSSPSKGLVVSLTIFIIVAAGAIALTAFARIWIAPGAALLSVLIIYPLWGWRRLAALDAFVRREALALSGGTPLTGGDRAAGLDRVAAQASQLQSLIGTIRDREDFISRVIAAAPDPMLVVDGNETVQLTNPQAVALLGSAASGLSFASVLSGLGDQSDENPDEIVTADRRTFIVSKARLAASHSSSELPTAGTVVRLVDITTLREAERGRKEMLEFLSHDMRSPQASILSLIANGAGARSQGDILGRIRIYAEKTLKLTDDFVQLARLSSIRLDLQDTNLSDVMTEVIEQLYPQSSSKGLRVEGVGLDDPQFATIDPWAISRALINILDNAIKHSPAGGVIRCEVKDAHPRSGVICSIADFGTGMPPERRQDIFKRFGHRDGFGVSAGLGLSFVKAAVDRHGAQITCEENAPSGTVFTLTFDEAAG